MPNAGRRRTFFSQNIRIGDAKWRSDRQIFTDLIRLVS